VTGAPRALVEAVWVPIVELTAAAGRSRRPPVPSPLPVSSSFPSARVGL